jgi:D-alanyl-D-alanine carboxypeptidase
MHSSTSHPSTSSSRADDGRHDGDPQHGRARRRRTRRAVAVTVVLAAVVVVGTLLALDAVGPGLGARWGSALDTHVGHDRGTGGSATATEGPDAGAVPPGTSVFDEDVPAVGRLDPALRAAVQRAARDASGEGVDFVVNSGWRSPAMQAAMLADAVEEYGSEREASRWVATPTTSEHVKGDAIDIGEWNAAEWLGDHGAAYGLCQVYGNEAWHFELRPEAVDSGCPRMFHDPTEDPRMQG